MISINIQYMWSPSHWHCDINLAQSGSICQQQGGSLTSHPPQGSSIRKWLKHIPDPGPGQSRESVHIPRGSHRRQHCWFWRTVGDTAVVQGKILLSKNNLIVFLPANIWWWTAYFALHYPGRNMEGVFELVDTLLEVHIYTKCLLLLQKKDEFGGWFEALITDNDNCFATIGE